MAGFHSGTDIAAGSGCKTDAVPLPPEAGEGSKLSRLLAGGRHGAERLLLCLSDGERGITVQ